MGISLDVYHESHIMRLRRFIGHALDTRYVANGVLVTLMVPDFSRFDLHGRRHRMCLVPGKFHFAVPARHCRGGTDLLRRISEYSYSDCRY